MNILGIKISLNWRDNVLKISIPECDVSGTKVHVFKRNNGYWTRTNIIIPEEN